MGQLYDSCPQNLLDWIQKQHLFFVATAPLSPQGHVNVSPKGSYDCFHIIGPNKVWYEDLTGSGSETIAHLRENGRITIMFTAFEGTPRVVRLFGTGRSLSYIRTITSFDSYQSTGTVYEFGTPEYEELLPKDARKPGSRAVIMVDVHKVGSSCGYSVPYYDYKGDRIALLEYFQKVEAKADASAADTRSDKGVREYWATHNRESIDGLPSVLCAPDSKEIPSNKWNKAEEVQKSEERVKAHRSRGKGLDDRSAHRNGNAAYEVKAVVNANAGPILLAAFGLGVLAALLCARVIQLNA